MNNVIVEYVRDKNKNPIGVVAAIDSTHIGFSKWNPKDRWNKNLGKKIAIGRAQKNDVTYTLIETLTLPNSYRSLFENKVRKVYDRAQRYYK